MRLVLLALALVLIPGVAAAQPASSPDLLQRLGTWGQKLVAIQQPVVTRYDECAPTLQRVVELARSGERQSAEEAKPLIDAIRQCVGNVRGAVASARDGYAQLGPMPREIERALHIDSRDVLNRSAAASEGLVTYLDLAVQSFEASVAGDRPLALAKLREARATATSAIDGQIVMVETLRASLPMATHKSMAGIRLSLLRSTRAIVASGEDGDGVALRGLLREQGAAARREAAQMRANWARESKSLRASVAQLGDPRRAVMMSTMDTSFEAIAQVGDDVAVRLDGNDSGPVDWPEAMETLDLIARGEARIQNAASAMAKSLN